MFARKHRRYGLCQVMMDEYTAYIILALLRALRRAGSLFLREVGVIASDLASDLEQYQESCKGEPGRDNGRERKRATLTQGE